MIKYLLVIVACVVILTGRSKSS